MGAASSTLPMVRFGSRMVEMDMVDLAIGQARFEDMFNYPLFRMMESYPGGLHRI